MLLAYAKLTLYSDLLESSVPDDPYLGRELSRYFPSQLVERYPDALEKHRLRREIISTQLTNSMINRGGPSFAVRIGDQTGASAPTIAAAFFVVRNSYDMIALNSAIDALDNKVSGKLQLDLYAAIEDLLLDRIVWFVRNVDVSKGLADVVEHYRAGIEQVTGALNVVLPPDAARVAGCAHDRACERRRAGRSRAQARAACGRSPPRPTSSRSPIAPANRCRMSRRPISRRARSSSSTASPMRRAASRSPTISTGSRSTARSTRSSESERRLTAEMVGERRHRAGGGRGLGLAARRRSRAHPRGGARHRELGADALQALGRGEPAVAIWRKHLSHRRCRAPSRTMTWIRASQPTSPAARSSAGCCSTGRRSRSSR